MINRTFFFDQVRLTLFGGQLKTSQVTGLSAILDEWERAWADSDDRWLAYMLATAHHETDRTMQPIAEYGRGKGRDYGKIDRNNQRAYGRGYVQLTWYYNYEKADQELGLGGRLIANYELALQPDIAAQVMFRGMTEGWFTSKKLSNYFNDHTGDWVQARRIINGLDKANAIATYAKGYYAAVSYTTA